MNLHQYYNRKKPTLYEQFCNTQTGRIYITTAAIISAGVILGTGIYYYTNNKQETTQQESPIETIVNTESQKELNKETTKHQLINKPTDKD